MMFTRRLKPIFFLVLSSALLISVSVQAQGPVPFDGEGTRSGGGGEAYKRAMGYIPRDLMDPTALIAVSGKKMLATYPGIQSALGVIAAKNLYFAIELERKIGETQFFFTRFLKKMNTSDGPECRVNDDRGSHGPKIAYTQSGIYTEDAVFLDQDVFDHFEKEVYRGTFVVHEVLHAYIPWDCHHNSSLRSFVQAVFEPSPRSDAAFNENMRLFGVKFPQESDELRAHRDLLALMLGNPAQARAALLSSKDPQVLLSSKWTSTELLERDQAFLALVQADPYGRLLRPFCEAADIQVIQALIDHPGVTAFDPAAICLEIVSSEKTSNKKMSESFRRFLLENLHVQEFGKEFFVKLAAKNIQSIEGRVVVDAVFAKIAAISADTRANLPLIELKPAKAKSWAQVSSSVRSWVHALSVLAASGDYERVARATARNEAFYPAFAFLQSEDKIEHLQPLWVERERQMATDNLREVLSSFLGQLLDRLPPAERAKLSTEIDWKRLGYFPRRN